MKKILLIGCLLCANLQAQFYNFESAATGSSGISTATARQNTGWTSNGTLARDTLATNYAIFGAKTFGVGGTTQAQNARAKLNVISFGDTIAAFIGDGNRAPGDSSVIVDLAGRLGIKTTINTSYSLTNLNGMLSGWYDANIGSSGNANTLISLQNSGSGAGTGASINIDGAIVRGIERSSVTDLELVAGTNGKVSLVPGSAGGLMFSRSAPTQSLQAFLTVRTAAIDDTLFMVRNDKNSTLDSTMMVFANGDGYFGGNNLYQGGHRWRSNAAGDSLILYDGNTMIMAFLSDGTIADLVAGTPPTSRRYIPPPDYIWLLRIGVFLLLLLSILMIYDFVTKLRAKRAQRERLKLLASYAIRRTDI